MRSVCRVLLKTKSTFCWTRSLSNVTLSFLISWRSSSSKSAAVYKISSKDYFLAEIRPYNDFQMAAVRHLSFYHHMRPPTRSALLVADACQNFMSIWYTDLMQMIYSVVIKEGKCVQFKRSKCMSACNWLSASVVCLVLCLHRTTGMHDVFGSVRDSVCLSILWPNRYWNFSSIWLEMPVQATWKWGFEGLWTPKCDYSSSPPKRHILV